MHDFLRAQIAQSFVLRPEREYGAVGGRSVFVVGQARRRGYTISSLSTLINALFALAPNATGVATFS
jgi:hypothetical protein